MCNENHV